MATAATITFDAGSHTYLYDGVPVPSVTQCLESAGLSDFSRVAPDVLERKRIIGTYVHGACEFLDQDDLVWETVDPTIRPYVEGYESWKFETKFEPVLIEHRGIASINGMKVGFTMDRFGLIDGQPYIVELKSSAQEEISWPVQLAGYELCAHNSEVKDKVALPALMMCGRVAVQLKPDGGYRCYRYDGNKGSQRSFTDSRVDFDCFRSCLFLETWKRGKR